MAQAQGGFHGAEAVAWNHRHHHTLEHGHRNDDREGNPCGAPLHDDLRRIEVDIAGHIRSRGASLETQGQGVWPRKRLCSGAGVFECVLNCLTSQFASPSDLFVFLAVRRNQPYEKGVMEHLKTTVKNTLPRKTVTGVSLLDSSSVHIYISPDAYWIEAPAFEAKMNRAIAWPALAVAAARPWP